VSDAEKEMASYKSQIAEQIKALMAKVTGYNAMLEEKTKLQTELKTTTENLNEAEKEILTLKN
jgi:hypothetical protein